MHLKSIIVASVAAIALAGIASPAMAFCHNASMFGVPFKNGEQCFTATTLNPGGGGASVRPYWFPSFEDPKPVAPVTPEEPVAEIPNHPNHEGENGIKVSLIGTVFEGFPAGTYTQIFAPIIPEYDFPGGVVDAVIFEDGTAYVWVISLGLPGLPA